MYRIRYYNQVIHPDRFSSRRFLGFLIVSLNWLRWKLETIVQGLVLRYLAQAGNVPDKDVKGLIRSFRLDVKAEEIEKERTSPLFDSPPEPPVSREERYVDARLPSVLEGAIAEKVTAPDRPFPLDNLIGQYGYNRRSKRHVHGRRFQFGGEDMFSPMGGEEKQ